MIIEAPKTIEDFREVKKTIIGLINNPHMNPEKLDDLRCRLLTIEKRIKELKK